MGKVEGVEMKTTGDLGVIMIEHLGVAISEKLLDERTNHWLDKREDPTTNSQLVGIFQCGWTDGYACGYERAKWVLGVDKLKCSGWVKCSERLPDSYQPILLLHGGGLCSVGCYDYAHRHWDVEGIGSLPFNEIKFWAKLPDKPEGE